VRPDSALRELRADLRGTRAALCPRRDEAGYETLTAEEPLLFQPIERFGDDPRPEAAHGELALELAAAVLAAGKQRDRAPLALGCLVRPRRRAVVGGLVELVVPVSAAAGAFAEAGDSRSLTPRPPHPPPRRPAPRRPSSARASRGSSPRSRRRSRGSESGPRARSPCPGRCGRRCSCTRNPTSR